jgi:hypothetical protein
VRSQGKGGVEPGQGSCDFAAFDRVPAKKPGMIKAFGGGAKIQHLPTAPFDKDALRLRLAAMPPLQQASHGALGATREEILADYPYLNADDITAVLQYAAREADHPVLRVA